MQTTIKGLGVVVQSVDMDPLNEVTDHSPEWLKMKEELYLDSSFRSLGPVELRLAHSVYYYHQMQNHMCDEAQWMSPTITSAELDTIPDYANLVLKFHSMSRVTFCAL